MVLVLVCLDHLMGTGRVADLVTLVTVRCHLNSTVSLIGRGAKHRLGALFNTNKISTLLHDKMRHSCQTLIMPPPSARHHPQATTEMGPPTVNVRQQTRKNIPQKK